jgi:hypothetical protein
MAIFRALKPLTLELKLQFWCILSLCFLMEFFLISVVAHVKRTSNSEWILMQLYLMILVDIFLPIINTPWVLQNNLEFLQDNTTLMCIFLSGGCCYYLFLNW